MSSAIAQDEITRLLHSLAADEFTTWRIRPLLERFGKTTCWDASVNDPAAKQSAGELRE